MADVNHRLDVLLVSFPVGEKYARCAWHGQQICIGGKSVAVDRVFCIIRHVATVLHVMVFNEGYGISAVVSIAHQRAVSQLRPVVAINGIAYGVPERKVERAALHLSVFLLLVDDVSQIVGISVPIFSY